MGHGAVRQPGAQPRGPELRWRELRGSSLLSADDRGATLRGRRRHDRPAHWTASGGGRCARVSPRRSPARLRDRRHPHGAAGRARRGQRARPPAPSGGGRFATQRGHRLGSATRPDEPVDPARCAGRHQAGASSGDPRSAPDGRRRGRGAGRLLARLRLGSRGASGALHHGPAARHPVGHHAGVDGHGGSRVRDLVLRQPGPPQARHDRHLDRRGRLPARRTHGGAVRAARGGGGLGVHATRDATARRSTQRAQRDDPRAPGHQHPPAHVLDRDPRRARRRRGVRSATSRGVREPSLAAHAPAHRGRSAGATPGGAQPERRSRPARATGRAARPDALGGRDGLSPQRRHQRRGRGQRVAGVR